MLEGLGVQKLIISGISGLALHWYVSGESLAGTTLACMSSAFVLVEIIKHGTWGPGGGRVFVLKERRAHSRVYVKGKERSPRIFFFLFLEWFVISQPGISEVLAFSIRLEKGQAF